MKKIFSFFIGGIFVLFSAFTAFAQDEAQSVLYTDEDYGFSVTMPSTWENAEVTEDTFDGIPYVTFSLESEDPDYGMMGIFSIGVYPLDDTISEFEEKIGANNWYQFSYSHFNGTAPDDLIAKVQALDDIKNSFTTFDMGALAEDELFESAAGLFKINFPGTPVEEMGIVETDIGPVENYNFIYEETDDKAFMVAYADLQINYSDDEEAYGLLEAGKNEKMTSQDFDNIDTDERIEIMGYPALYYKINDGEYFVTYKTVVIGSRLYQIGIINTGDYVSEEEEQAFMDSFEFTGDVITMEEHPFPDTIGHENEEAISYVKATGAVEGYSDGTYKPENEINRAEFTKIMIANDYLDSDIIGANCFSDIEAEWFSRYVCFAKDLGIIDGYPDGSFKPADNINLAEALKIILEADSMIEVPEVSGEWFQKYMDKAEEIGMLDNVNDDPAHFITRGEMAQLIYDLRLYIGV